MVNKEEGKWRVLDSILRVSSILSTIHWMIVIIVASLGLIGTFLFLMNNPIFGIILGILLTVIVLAIISIFINRKEKERLWKELEEKLNINKEVVMYYWIGGKGIPVVEFWIKVENRTQLKVEPYRILLDLDCDIIPQKTFFWDRNYNIETIKQKVYSKPEIEAPEIEATEDGNIIIRYPCGNIYYNHDFIHDWKLTGKVTFHSKIRDIDKEIILGSKLDKKDEEKLKKEIEDFQKFYLGKNK